MSISGELLPIQFDAAVKENPDIPIALHLDHGENFAQCKGFRFGLALVMVDGSFDQKGKLPAMIITLN
ncbi:MAG: hypothetical protein U5N58_07210 [Actinomycetota bacterium]|nr:hypothetical protein [Actinomycetota bacterium]